MRRWICVLVRWSWNDSCKSRASQSERRLQTSNESGPELSDRARNQANELVFLQFTGLQEIHSTWQWSAGRNFEHTCIARGKKRTPLKAAVVCRSGARSSCRRERGNPTRQLACNALGIEACVRFHCRRPRSYVGIEKQYRERICAHHISMLGRTSKTPGTATRPRG